VGTYGSRGTVRDLYIRELVDILSVWKRWKTSALLQNMNGYPFVLTPNGLYTAGVVFVGRWPMTSHQTNSP